MTTTAARHPARVTVIGGGFCGGFFAAQLAHHACVPVTISVIEPRATLGAGVAYSTLDPAHRVNTAASRMTLFAEDPTHFDSWLRANGELVRDPQALWSDGHAYPRRATFGRYVAEILAERQAARSDVTIHHIRDKAVAVTRFGGGYNVELGAGGRLAADVIVLATSHPPPGLPAMVAALGADPALISDPWRADALDNIAPNAVVLIIGVGLTMADVVTSLDLRGHAGPIIVYSRRGLLPRGHAKTPPAPFTWFDTHEAPHNVADLVRQVRELVAAAAREDRPWQAVFDNIRANGQNIWRTLDEVERRRFLRHLRVYWDAHRYRIAPQAAAVLQRKQGDGSLRVLAASLQSIGRDANGIEAVLHPRGKPQADRETVHVDNVVVTTGPNHGTVVTQNPVLQSLAHQGLLHADALGLGLAVDANGQVIQANGTSLPSLLVVGPLAREQYGELMGMPQVSAQPNAVARHVAAMLAARTSQEMSLAS